MRYHVFGEDHGPNYGEGYMGGFNTMEEALDFGRPKGYVYGIKLTRVVDTTGKDPDHIFHRQSKPKVDESYVNLVD